MGSDLSQVGVLVRREIEARIAGPLIKAFMEKFGQEETLAVVRPLIEELAKESGAQLAESLGGNSIDEFTKGLGLWTKGDALEMEILEQTETTLSQNITRCRYADMYRELGLADLGKELSCGRDFAMTEGFNPKLKLTRTQTIMEGAPYCDFRYRMEE